MASDETTRKVGALAGCGCALALLVIAVLFAVTWVQQSREDGRRRSELVVQEQRLAQALAVEVAAIHRDVLERGVDLEATSQVVYSDVVRVDLRAPSLVTRAVADEMALAAAERILARVPGAGVVHAAVDSPEGQRLASVRAERPDRP